MALKVIIAVSLAGSVLLLALAVVLAPGDMAPGAVGLICGASWVLAGMALLMAVMRRLLLQAIEQETEVRVLRTDLDQVV